jgi:hypothetical protein
MEPVMKQSPQHLEAHEHDAIDLDAVSGGISVARLASIVPPAPGTGAANLPHPGFDPQQPIGFDPHLLGQPVGFAPNGQPAFAPPQGVLPQGLVPQGALPQGLVPQQGLPPGYVVVPQNFVSQVQTLLAHPPAAPPPQVVRVPVPTPTAAAPQVNPLAQIQQGMSLVTSLSGLMKGFGGGASSAGSSMFGGANGQAGQAAGQQGQYADGQGQYGDGAGYGDQYGDYGGGQYGDYGGSQYADAGLGSGMGDSSYQMADLGGGGDFFGGGGGFGGDIGFG